MGYDGVITTVKMFLFIFGFIHVIKLYKNNLYLLYLLVNIIFTKLIVHNLNYYKYISKHIKYK